MTLVSLSWTFFFLEAFVSVKFTLLWTNREKWRWNGRWIKSASIAFSSHSRSVFYTFRAREMKRLSNRKTSFSWMSEENKRGCHWQEKEERQNETTGTEGYTEHKIENKRQIRLCILETLLRIHHDASLILVINDCLMIRDRDNFSRLERKTDEDYCTTCVQVLS